MKQDIKQGTQKERAINLEDIQNKEHDKKSSISQISIPSYIFRDRTLKVLEILVEYMKEQKKLTYHEIAVLLNRDDRTVWTVYSRAKKKRRNRDTQ